MSKCQSSQETKSLPPEWLTLREFVAKALCIVFEENRGAWSSYSPEEVRGLKIEFETHQLNKYDTIEFIANHHNFRVAYHVADDINKLNDLDVALVDESNSIFCHANGCAAAFEMILNLGRLVRVLDDRICIKNACQVSDHQSTSYETKLRL